MGGDGSLMGRVSLGEEAVRLIQDAMSAAPRGTRSRAARELAERWSVSEATIWRAARRGGPKRKRAPARPEYREWTPVVVLAQHAAPKPIPMDIALRHCIETGKLPPEAAEMPVSAVYRTARELGLTERRLHRRESAEWPQQAVLVDASTSDHLVAVRRLDDGDWLLRLHRGPYSASGYKNKPLPPTRERVWVWALWDMCTGLTASRYLVAPGEAAQSGLEFLCWVWGGGRAPMRGLPDDLWLDSGPLRKSKSAVDLLGRLGVATVPGKPYSSARMGGVERSHRTRFSRFERALFLDECEEIKLSKLNRGLATMERREGETRFSRTPVDGVRVSRAAAWDILAARRPEPIRALPENALATLAAEVRRRVDAAGVVSWDGVEWEIDPESAPALVGRWVICRRRIVGGGGEIVVEDEVTGDRSACKPLERRPYGEVSSQTTPLERLLGGAASRKPARSVTQAASSDTDGTQEPPRLRALPARLAPAASLEDPAAPAADAYGSVSEALAALARMCPLPIPPGDLRLIGERLEERGLTRSAVRSLAAHILRTARGRTA